MTHPESQDLRSYGLHALFIGHCLIQYLLWDGLVQSQGFQHLRLKLQSPPDRTNGISFLAVLDSHCVLGQKTEQGQVCSVSLRAMPQGSEAAE